MKITENIKMLEIPEPKGDFYRPTLTWDDEHLVLFDTGIPGMGALIAEEIKKAGFKPEDLTDIIITHQDIDHIGGALELLKLAPDAKVYGYEVDAPFIEGTETPTKLALMQGKLDSGEIDETDSFYQMLKTGFAKSHLPVDVKLKDGEVLDFCGGIETVFTPGHTPGHATFYLQKSKIMVCGDAANIVDGKLVGSNPAMTWDNEKAEASLEKIKSFDLAGVICYHTGFLEFK
ncbi:MAG: MBL fold metallo-hydrolase [Streptococcaceae bacterium]|jgi:glyoxylase-like metal-dependent hydrolase (beta-lactamase superfamily II)|nr:MBL fold metallo-hydrolase [Streptococcaceae bacterium]